MIKFSPSQLVTFRRCRRMYAYHYNEGLCAPSSQKQEFGTLVHKYLEEWLSKGLVPPRNSAGEVAKQGLKHLPAPKSRLETEKEWVLEWNNDFCVGGFIDLLVYADVPMVIDHKTTSDLKWAKTESGLKVDEQALLYSLWAMLHFSTSKIIAKWVYYAATNPPNKNRKPKGCKATQVEFISNDQFFLNQIHSIEDDFKRMFDVRKSKIPGVQLQPSLDACELYGGCWHKAQGRCADLSDEDLFYAAMMRNAK